MSQEQIDNIEKELASTNDEIDRLVALRSLESLVLLKDIEKNKLELERRVAAIRGDEYASKVDLKIPVGYNWFVVGGFGRDARLICDHLKREPGCVVFTFTQTRAMKFGGLNDEVFEGHPLYGKGLGIGGYFIVNNSRWLEQIRSGMKLHSGFNHELWDRMKHFLFRGKGGDFECLATGFVVTHER